VVDQHLRPFANGELNRDLGVVLREDRRRVDGGVFVAEVLIGQLQRVAVHGELSRHERRARGQAEASAKRRLVDRFIAGERHRIHDRGHPFGDGDAGDDRHLAGVRAARGRLHGAHDLRRRKAAPPIEVPDQRHVGVEQRRGIRLTVAHAQCRPELGDRNRRGTGNLVLGDPKQPAAVDRKRHFQLAVLLDPRVRRPRIAIALSPEELLDAVGRVLEQILVHRTLALDRHEFLALVRRQRIEAGDRHLRARRHRQRHMGPTILVFEPDLGLRLRLVIAVGAQLLDIAIDARAERNRQIRRAGAQPQPPEQLAALDRRLSDDVDVADDRSRTGVQREHQDSALRLVLDVGARRDRGMQVTPLPKEIGEQTRHVGQPAERRRSAVAFHDGAAQVVAVDAGLPFAAGETDLGDRMNRRQLVAERDPAILELGIDAHVFEPRQAEEMGHGLPHLAHRQRPTGERFDDAREHGIDGRAAFNQQPYRADGFTEIVFDGGRGGAREE
jgi:hypothetical protein